MIEGTVKFFNATKNFGFITGDDGKDYFVHITGVVGGVPLRDGDKVKFEPTQGDKGLKADKVEKA
ncbi:MAG: cold-shock protein [Candidatus Bilamarchaeaceae archaeon]